MGNQKTKGWGDELTEKLLPQPLPPEPISLTLIVPTYNCADVIASTLESIEKQEYPHLEVIVIDAGSTDRTLQIVNSYADLITRIYTVTSYNLPDMINRGISLASGTYLDFLFPGSFYLTSTAYQTFAHTVHQNAEPDIIYCGSIQREINREPRTIFLPLDENLLRRGHHPATLSACWIKADLFDRVGKFDPTLTIRPGFEFFCRVVQTDNITAAQIERVFVDFDYGRFSYGKILRFASETWRILHAHFGLKAALSWFFTINHLLVAKGLFRRTKQLLFKK